MHQRIRRIIRESLKEAISLNDFRIDDLYNLYRGDKRLYAPDNKKDLVNFLSKNIPELISHLGLDSDSVSQSVANTKKAPKPLSNKVYTQPEMVKMGGNYHLQHGMLMMIPVDQIDGLDPAPGSWSDDEGNEYDFEAGVDLSAAKPIEVVYDENQDSFLLYDGNHRVTQANLNRDEYIKAFVQADRQQYKKWQLATIREIVGESLMEDDYVYHGTSTGALIRIQKQGLQPKGNTPIFFSNQEQYALTYASRKDFRGGALLRVKKTSNMQLNPVDETGGYKEWYSTEPIPPSEIEVKTNSQWISLDIWSLFESLNEVNSKQEIENKEPGISDYIDIIDLDPSNPSYEKYKEILKLKYNVDYQPPSERYQRENDIISNYKGKGYITTTDKGLEISISAFKTPNIERRLTVQAATEDMTSVGRVGFGIDLTAKTIRIGGAQVNSEYRRQGVYSKLVDFVEKVANENGLQIIDSGKSDDAKAFWDNRNIHEGTEKDIWYHGSADARSLKSGFEQRNISAVYITNPELMHQLQADMKSAKKAGDDKAYWEALDKVSSTKTNVSMKAPLFFTNNRGVAQTYATDKQAFDYQNSEPGVFAFEIEPGRNAKINAPGRRFRHIEIDIIKKGFIASGANQEDVELAFERLNWPDNYRGKATNTTIGLIGQELGFDTVDVIGVLDSYRGGNIRSTVRMVWDVSRIKPT